VPFIKRKESKKFIILQYPQIRPPQHKHHVPRKVVAFRHDLVEQLPAGRRPVLLVAVGDRIEHRDLGGDRRKTPDQVQRQGHSGNGTCQI